MEGTGARRAFLGVIGDFSFFFGRKVQIKEIEDDYIGRLYIKWTIRGRLVVVRGNYR